MRELRENDRIVDWDGDEGVALNVRLREGNTIFDMQYDNGSIAQDYVWFEDVGPGSFRFLTEVGSQ